jgi:carboxymethylenebutenolidase
LITFPGMITFKILLKPVSIKIANISELQTHKPMKNLTGILVMLFIFSQVFAQDWAVKMLESSPRHQENVIVKDGERSISCFVVYPEVPRKASVVILIHENRGLTDWARSMADQLAAQGFIVIAPDLLSGKAPNGGNTPDFSTSDDAMKAIYNLDADGVTSALNMVFNYAQKIPSGNGKVSVGGFCWGGGQTFRYSTNNPNVSAALVFYGTGPSEAEEYKRISAPVYGFYGGNDERVNATIETSGQMMKDAGKKYEPVIYDGAGHGFMRAGQEPTATEPNKKARDEAFKRMIEILNKI